MNTSKQPLIINKLESKDVYDYLVENNLIGVNELYLIPNDNVDEVVSVDYVSGSNNKFTYTTVSGQTIDIVTVANLKTMLNLASVASNGQYTSLTSKPSINGVELNGNKTTSELNISLNYSSDSITNKPSINGVTLTGSQTTQSLNISYNDLDDLPNIPTTSNTYVAGDTGSALTSKGVEGALINYVPKTTSVTGNGALGGGGQLNGNVSITHNKAPSGLSTSAVKIGVDDYGHVCVGQPITATDVNAVPIKSEIVSSITSLDGSNTNIAIVGLQSETLGFSTTPESGKTITLRYANETENTLNITIPSSLSNILFYNGVKVTTDTIVAVLQHTSVRLDVTFFNNSGTTYCFIEKF